MADFVFMRHAETDGEARIPDEPGVVASYEARGWERSEEPEQAPFVPPKPLPPGDEWVELVHPLIDARHAFPNDPAAIAGAMEAGWEYPKAEPDPPAKKATGKKAAKPADKDEE